MYESKAKKKKVKNTNKRIRGMAQVVESLLNTCKVLGSILRLQKRERGRERKKEGRGQRQRLPH
jgi:hypothetical protein